MIYVQFFEVNSFHLSMWLRGSDVGKYTLFYVINYLCLLGSDPFPFILVVSKEGDVLNIETSMSWSKVVHASSVLTYYLRN